jgi:hypothetical protein
MDRATFLADQNVSDTLLFEKRIIDREHGAAWVAEHELDAEVAQRLDQDVRSRFLDGHCHTHIKSAGA